VKVDSLSDTLLRLPSVKSGMMDENDKSKEEEGGGLEGRMSLWFFFPGRVNAESLYPFPTLRVLLR
jgi:hypothetical protein